MRRAVIVATGDLASLPAEVQDVANILSEGGYTVRLCLGADATRAEYVYRVVNLAGVGNGA